MTEKIRKEGAPVFLLQVLLAIFPFMIGVFYVWLSGLLLIIFMICLFWITKVRGNLKICRDGMFISVSVLVLAYGISAFYAVDHGMAAFGFVKFLPLPFFVLVIEQLDVGERKELLRFLPVSGAIMVILSFFAVRLKGFSEYFMVNNRLAGFFQYPNTFALFLLCCVIILLFQKKQSIWTYLLQAVLFTGILLSGSRTGLVLWLLTIGISVYFRKGYKSRFGLPAMAVCFVIMAGIYALVSGNSSSVGRFLTLSAGSSTFLGRILYYRDALPVILKHPFGLGYLGYYFSQGSFQTGVYSVMYIHNDPLQMLLDVGWFPTLVCLVGVVRSVLKNKDDAEVIFLTAVILAHSLFDLNMQYLAIDLILLSVVVRSETSYGISLKAKTPVYVIGLGFILFSLYLSLSSFLEYLNKDQEAVSVYPGNTLAWSKLITQTDDIDEMERIADEILEWNPGFPLANSAKARTSYGKGDFGSMVRYKETAIKGARYSLEEYLDYFDMLAVGVSLYMQTGDMKSAEFCRQKILQIPDDLAKVKESTSALGWSIHDLPELDLPEEYLEYLEKISE